MGIKGKAFKHLFRLAVDAGSEIIEEISQKIDEAADKLEKKGEGGAEQPKPGDAPQQKSYVIQTSDSGQDFKNFLERLKVFDPKLSLGKVGPMAALDVYPIKTSMTLAQINALCPPSASCFEVVFQS